MLALLKTRDESKDFRALYRERLREIAENTQDNYDPPTEAAIQEETTATIPLDAEPADMTLPEVVQEASTVDADPDEFRALAKQIAPKWIDALTEGIREIFNLAAGQQSKAEDVIDRMVTLSDEVHRFNSEIPALRERAEYMELTERELTGRTAMLEGKLLECAANDRQFIDDLRALANAQARDRESQGLLNSAVEEQLRQMGQSLTQRLNDLERRIATWTETVSLASQHVETILPTLEKQCETSARMAEGQSHIEEAQRVLERRLDAQAEVLRTLHASEQGRGSELQAVLQSIMKLGLTASSPLPEGL